MTVQRVSFLQNLGTVYTAEEMRRFLRTLGSNNGGVNKTGDYAVTQNGTPNMSVNVAAGECYVLGSETSTQGVYYTYNDATLNKTIAASDPTNPRNDIVCVRVRDAFYSGANNDGDVFVVTGTPAASPADPTTPANALRLARVRVDALATTIVTAKITDLRTWSRQTLQPGGGGWFVQDSTLAFNNLALTDAGNLTVRGTVTTGTANYHAEAYRSSALSIANGFVFTDLPFDTEETSGDPASSYNTTTGVYTTPAAGLYHASCGVLFNAATAGAAALLLVKNASSCRRLAVGYATSNPGASGATIVRCAAGDALKVQVAQSTATNPGPLFTGADLCWVEFAYVGA